MKDFCIAVGLIALGFGVMIAPLWIAGLIAAVAVAGLLLLDWGDDEPE